MILSSCCSISVCDDETSKNENFSFYFVTIPLTFAIPYIALARAKCTSVAPQKRKGELSFGMFAFDHFSN